MFRNIGTQWKRESDEVASRSLNSTQLKKEFGSIFYYIPAAMESSILEIDKDRKLTTEQKLALISRLYDTLRSLFRHCREVICSAEEKKDVFVELFERFVSPFFSLGDSLPGNSFFGQLAQQSIFLCLKETRYALCHSLNKNVLIQSANDMSCCC